MEVLFSYMSGLGEKIDRPASFFNERTEKFFFDRSYSKNIRRIMFILIPQNIGEQQVSEFKTKYTKTEWAVAINIYLDCRPFINDSFFRILKYIEFVLINTLEKNKRLKKTLEGYELFLLDLKTFFNLELVEKKLRTT